MSNWRYKIDLRRASMSGKFLVFEGLFRKTLQKVLSQISIRHGAWHTFRVLAGIAVFSSITGACNRPMPQPDKFGLGTQPIGQFFKDHDIIDERFTQELKSKFESKNKFDDFEYYQKVGMICNELISGHSCYYIGVVELRADRIFYLRPSKRSGWIKYSIYEVKVNCTPGGCGNIVMMTTYWQAR